MLEIEDCYLSSEKSSSQTVAGEDSLMRIKIKHSECGRDEGLSHVRNSTSYCDKNQIRISSLAYLL